MRVFYHKAGTDELFCVIKLTTINKTQGYLINDEARIPLGKKMIPVSWGISKAEFVAESRTAAALNFQPEQQRRVVVLAAQLMNAGSSGRGQGKGHRDIIVK